MNHRLTTTTALLLAVAAGALSGTMANAADLQEETATSTKRTAVLLALGNISPQRAHLDAENLEIADSALSQALENLERDNRKELEMRISDRKSEDVSGVE